MSLDEQIRAVFTNTGELFLRYLPDLLSSLAVTAIIAGVFFILRLVFLRVALPRVGDESARLAWRRISGYSAFFISILFLIPVWFPTIREMATFLGIFGAGILIAFKEVILNLAGWFYIVIRRPFDPGNRVIVADKIGDVIDIRLMEFSLLEVRPRHRGGQSTGRVVHVPNSFVFTQTMSNSSKEFSFYWNELEVVLTVTSDWKKAEAIVAEVSNKVIENVSEVDSRIRYSRKEYAIRYRALTPSVYVDVQQGGIHLTLRYLCEPKQTRQVSDKVWREILSAFADEPNIVLKGE